MKDFVNFLNDAHNYRVYEYPELSELTMEIQDDLRTMYATTVQEQLFIEKKYEGGGIGVSQLGKPAIITAWDYHMGKTHNGPPSYALKRKWLDGHLFELWVFFLLRSLGYEVEHQASVSVNAVIPNGHPDFVVTNKKGCMFVVECKHMSDSNYKQYKKKGMYNDQYITQLALYCRALNCPGMWVIGNTDTGECMGIPFDELQIKANETYVTRAMQVASVVTACEDFNQCLRYISLPPHQTTRDGRRYPPPTMYAGKGVLHPAASLWKLTKNDVGQYTILGYNYPNEAKQYEPEWEA